MVQLTQESNLERILPSAPLGTGQIIGDFKLLSNRQACLSPRRG